MKYRPSNLKKLEKREERSEHHMEVEDDKWKEAFMHERTEKQKKKQAKRHEKEVKENAIHLPPTINEKNKMHEKEMHSQRDRRDKFHKEPPSHPRNSPKR